MKTRVGVAFVSILLMSGCSSGGATQPMGADPAKAGPQIPVATEPTAATSATPAAVPSAVPTTVQATTGATTATGLAAQLRAALFAKDPDADSASVTVEQRPFAENQLVLTWTVNTVLDDDTAPLRVREDAIELLRIAKTCTLTYGSILLIAQGTVTDGGASRKVQAIRAKYSRALVLRTDWTTVPPARIFTLPDDKPAEIFPFYR